MSAYLVSDNHINAILKYLLKHHPRDLRYIAFPLGNFADNNEKAIEAIGNELLAENNRSVNHRYGERKKAPKLKIDLAGPAVKDYEAAKLLSCLDYQSCEAKGWKKSKAYQIIASIREYMLDAAMLKMRGDAVEGAPWSI